MTGVHGPMPSANPSAPNISIAICMYGKIGSETTRSFTVGVRASPAIIAQGYFSTHAALIAPARRSGMRVDVFGHTWSPEAEETVRKLWRPVSLEAERDKSMQFDQECRSRRSMARHEKTYPMSCGRTMSHLLGMQRVRRDAPCNRRVTASCQPRERRVSSSCSQSIEAKRRHEARGGFTYSAVLVSRWDVVWTTAAVLPWLTAAVTATGGLDRFWLPDMCAARGRVTAVCNRPVQRPCATAACDRRVRPPCATAVCDRRVQPPCATAVSPSGRCASEDVRGAYGNRSRAIGAATSGYISAVCGAGSEKMKPLVSPASR